MRRLAPVRLRRATLRDLPSLVLQRRRMFEAMGYRDPAALNEADRVYARWVRRQTRAGRFVAFVAEGGGRVVAGGAVWLQDRQPRPGFAGGPVPYLLSMYTDPDFRRRGLATRIVREAEAWCRRSGFGSMTLHASAEGRRVYEKLGWERTWEYATRLARPRKPLTRRAARAIR